MKQPKLTIGMACFDDPQGVWWTLSAIRQYHVDIAREDVDLLVINDHPSFSQDLMNMCALTKTRLVHKPKNRGPAHAKNSIWENAIGSHVLMLDCHVLLGKNSVDYILDAIDKDEIKQDMWCGPLRGEGGSVIATELDPELRGDFFGVWSVKDADKVHEIGAHGSAYALMKKEHWPTFSNNFRGFAGEEIYIHDKVRKNGGKVVYHPSLGWVHRFPRFGPVPYTLTLNDKMHNYCIAAYESGWNVLQMREYFGRRLPQDQKDVIEKGLTDIYPDIFADAPSWAEKVKTHD